MMRRRYTTRWMVWIAAAGLGWACAPRAAHAACAGTRAEAAAGLGALHTPDGERGGFRVASTRWDPVLRQRWAQVASCDHPEWPTVELPVSGAQQSLSASQVRQPGGDSLLPLLPMVHAGDVVQFWSREDAVRIEVAAIAEQSGALGKTVRVRLMQRGTLGQQAEEQFTGVVRGPHDVEMQR